MKKLLFQFDTDAYPAVFDTVVAYDGGADHVTGYANVTPDNVSTLVDGAIFTRAPKDKKNTAIFVGGSHLSEGKAIFEAIQRQFFLGFKVSVMLDCNGCNTTAAAGVAKLTTHGRLKDKKAVILAGTGPVGQRVAVMLAKEGAKVSLTSRKLAQAEEICADLKQQFEVNITALEAIDMDARGVAVEQANIVFATGAAGVELLKMDHWKNNPHIELIADANTTPPLGIGGIDMMDKGIERHGKIMWGAIGFGALKLALHRACIAKLFEDNKQVLDADAIFALAKTMA
ncbi:MAG: methylenetetrahydrofolate dehydrogenase [Methylococcales bacterium]|nr:methylenetetrahydrofolate dehydrogenase [Methylococcales bacterium]